MTDTWTWATVTQASPLRIKVDGDTSALDATTDDLVGSLAVDDRVRVHLHSDGIIVTGIQGGGNRSNPNLIINSNFMVNQRGAASGASVAHNAYLLDRWKNVSGGGRTFSWSDTGGVRTFTLVSDVTYGTQMDQPVEARNLPAGTYTISCPNTAVVLSATTSAATLTSGAGGVQTFTTDGTLDVNIGVYEPAGSTQALTWIKLERGAVATPYQPPTYDDDLRACVRYYWRMKATTTSSYSRLALGFAISATRVVAQVPLHVPMRVAVPTVIPSGSLGLYDGVSGVHALTALAQGESGSAAIELLCDSTSLTQYRPHTLLTAGDSNAFIAFDAEL